MHEQAHTYIAAQATELGSVRRVVEFGGRNINGSVRDLFDAGDYISIDLVAGPGVDVVADCRSWRTRKPIDVVVCCEVLEHAEDVAGIATAAARLLAKGGTLLLTAACDERAPHSAVDGGPLRDGEHYANVDPAELEDLLAGLFDRVEVEVHTGRGDVYAAATKAAA